MSSTTERTLKTIQVSTDGNLIGKERQSVKRLVQGPLFSKQPVKVFHDVSSPTAVKQTREVCIQVSPQQTEVEVQTDVADLPSKYSTDSHNDSGVGAADLDQEAFDLMVKEPIPENYWRDLAEERRLSLAEALAENEMLHQSIEELKTENENLSLLAGQAEHLASVLNDVLGDDDDVVKLDNKTNQTKSLTTETTTTAAARTEKVTTALDLKSECTKTATGKQSESS